MKEQGVLIFAPGFPTNSLDFKNEEILLEAFTTRIEEFYFRPCAILNDMELGFASGVLLLSAMDFAGRYLHGKSSKYRMEKILSSITSISEHDQSGDLIKYIIENFRNGLIHEGRIKKEGMFDYGIVYSFDISKTAFVLNPLRLTSEFETSFYKEMKIVKSNPIRTKTFIDRLKSDFSM